MMAIVLNPLAPLTPVQVGRYVLIMGAAKLTSVRRHLGLFPIVVEMMLGNVIAAETATAVR